MIVGITTLISQFYLVANAGSVPYTNPASSGAPYYFAFVPLTPRKTYSVKIVTPDKTFRAASFTEEPDAANINGIRTLCEPQSNPPAGFNFVFTADDNELCLVLYCGGVGNGATGICTVEINEIRNPHDYNSVEEMIAAGTQNMTVLVNNVAYDDNAYTISSPPSWLKFNGITATSILASGNTWFGINSSTEHIKFNRRDTKMYYLYREDGTVYNHFRFLKLRWRGYSVYNQTSSSYLQEWEVYFFDTGDVMIRAVSIPTSSYNGTFNIVASQTYTYNPLTTASPIVTFYSKNDNHSVFEIKYEPIVLKCWNDKWLIEDEGVFYNIVDGELNPLEITEITAQNMMDLGNDEIPDGTLLVSLTEPKLHHWNDSDLFLEEPLQPTIAVNLTAVPFPQTLDVVVDMSHETITGIMSVTAQFAGELSVCYSLDDGETYTEEESVMDFLNEDFTAIYEGLSESKHLYLRFVFRNDASLTNIRFTFRN